MMGRMRTGCRRQPRTCDGVYTKVCSQWWCPPPPLAYTEVLLPTTDSFLMTHIDEPDL